MNTDIQKPIGENKLWQASNGFLIEVLEGTNSHGGRNLLIHRPPTGYAPKTDEEHEENVSAAVREWQAAHPLKNWGPHEPV